MVLPPLRQLPIEPRRVSPSWIARAQAQQARRDENDADKALQRRSHGHKDPTKDDRQGLARERPEPSTADVAADKDEAGAE